MKTLTHIVVIAFIIALSGCGLTNHIISRKNVQHENTPMEEIARKFYSTAKGCWTTEESALYAATIVENNVSLDSISVTARFDSFGSGVLNPFLKFEFTKNGTDTNVELMTQEIKWRGYDQHMLDANNWLIGNFTCSFHLKE